MFVMVFCNGDLMNDLALQTEENYFLGGLFQKVFLYAKPKGFNGIELVNRLI